MHVLPLESGIVYGPVRSRRLGTSLGINVLPLRRKVCSFDCVYCHYGATATATLSPDASEFPGVPEIIAAVERALRRSPHVDSLTFSGNGEPTLHPYFRDVVLGVRRLRDRLSPEARLSLFSNATTAHLPRVREALVHLDTPIMKLDAGDPETLARINRPVPAVSLASIVAGLKGVPNLVTQSTLIDGEVSNARGQPFEAWLALLADLRPTQVQIYSTDYPVAETGVERVPPYRLRRIAEEIRQRTGLDVRAYWPEF